MSNAFSYSIIRVARIPERNNLYLYNVAGDVAIARLITAYRKPKRDPLPIEAPRRTIYLKFGPPNNDGEK